VLSTIEKRDFVSVAECGFNQITALKDGSTKNKYLHEAPSPLLKIALPQHTRAQQKRQEKSYALSIGKEQI
jgi:hypothetical protein